MRGFVITVLLATVRAATLWTCSSTCRSKIELPYGDSCQRVYDPCSTSMNAIWVSSVMETTSSLSFFVHSNSDCSGSSTSQTFAFSDTCKTIAPGFSDVVYFGASSCFPTLACSERDNCGDLSFQTSCESNSSCAWNTATGCHSACYSMVNMNGNCSSMGCSDIPPCLMQILEASLQASRTTSIIIGVILLVIIVCSVVGGILVCVLCNRKKRTHAEPPAYTVTITPGYSQPMQNYSGGPVMVANNNPGGPVMVGGSYPPGPLGASEPATQPGYPVSGYHADGKQI